MELFVNNLTTIDFSFFDPLRGIVGESVIVDINLQGALDSQSMIVDFSSVKKRVKAFLDSTIDHALVLPIKNSLVSCASTALSAEVALYNEKRELDYFVSGPAESFCLIEVEKIDFKSLQKWINTRLETCMPGNVDNVSVILREEALTGPCYHYAHGLKKHGGNCQRIAHGHRSMIEIYINGARDNAWERFWAERWKDCYLLSEQDITERSRLSPVSQQFWNDAFIASAYTGSQGRFELLIRPGRVEILPHDTTVERIAHFIKQETMRLDPKISEIRVIAYEGIQKGAAV